MRFEVYRGEDGQWYWRLRSANHQVVATGAEGYMRKSDAKRAIRKVQDDVSRSFWDRRVNGREDDIKVVAS